MSASPPQQLPVTALSVLAAFAVTAASWLWLRRLRTVESESEVVDTKAEEEDSPVRMVAAPAKAEDKQVRTAALKWRSNSRAGRQTCQLG